MLLPLLSVATLFVGPLAHRALRRTSTALRALDGFVFVAIGGIAVVSLIPSALTARELGKVGIAAIAILLLRAFERAVGHRRGAHQTALVLAMVGLASHGALDGVALAGVGTTRPLVGVVVALHHLPVGLAVWWLIRPTRGPAVALAVLAGIGAALFAGFLLGAPLRHALESGGADLSQALFAAVLLHVVFHGPAGCDEQATPTRRGDFAEGLGGLLGLGLILLTGEADLLPLPRGGEASAGSAFLTLALESAPALLVAYAFAGLVQAFLPQGSAAWMGRGPTLLQSLKGLAFAVPLPICSCGVVPVYRSLIVQGVPATAAMAFLLAAPELGLDALLLSLPLLGGALTIARLASVVAVTVIVSLVVGHLVRSRRDTRAPWPYADRPRGTRARLRAAVSTGFVELVDHTGPWMLLGLGVAAVLEPLLQVSSIADVPGWMQVPLFALLGMPGYVCASGATPLVAVLVHKGASAGAAIAFLLTGPATNVTTYLALSRLHGKRVAVAFGLAVAVLAVCAGWAVDGVLAPRAAATVALHGIGVHDHGGIEAACLAALAVAFVLSVLRQGPRCFVAQLFPLGAHGSGHHDHHHDHGHAAVPAGSGGCGHDHHDEPAEHTHDHGHHCGHDHSRPVVIRLGRPPAAVPPEAGTSS